MKMVRSRSGVVLAAALLVASLGAPSVVLAANAPPPMPIAPQNTAPPAAPAPVPATTPSPLPVPIAGAAVIAAFSPKTFPYTLVSGGTPAAGVVIHIATGNSALPVFLTNASKVAVELTGKVNGTFTNCSETVGGGRLGYVFTFTCPASTTASTPAP